MRQLFARGIERTEIIRELMNDKAVKRRRRTAGCLYKVAVGIVCAECRPVVVGAEEDILIAAGFKRIVN